MQIQRSLVYTSTGVQLNVTIDLKGQDRLFAIEACEQTSTARQVFDLVQISLEYTTGGIGIDLKIGNIGPGGSMRWQGDILPQQSMKAVIRFLYPASGSKCYVNFVTGAPHERYTSRESPIIVQQSPNGKPRIVNVNGAADATTLALRPDVGSHWQVLECLGVHDDTTSRTLRWQYSDGTLEVMGDVTAAIAASVNHYLSDAVTGTIRNKALGAPILTNECYLNLIASALTAGKKIYIRALVMEYGGGL